MRREVVVAVTLAGALLPPSAASANDFQNVYNQYKRSGTIKPCRFSDGELRNAERETPPDVAQYAPSFLDALQSAREHSASCNKKPAAAPTPAPATQTTPTPSAPAPAPTQTTVTPPPAPATTPAPAVPTQPTIAGVPSPPVAHPERVQNTPTPVWLLAALAGLGVLAALGAALAWWFGWSADRLTRPFAASSAEFADRLRDFRLEFGEWLRTGH